MGKKEDDHRYYLKNKEKIRKYLKEYYLKNQEKLKSRARENHWNNRELILKQHKEYHIKNKKKMNEKGRIWQKKNRQKTTNWLKNYNIQRRKEDPNFNIRNRLRSRLYVVLRLYGYGKKAPANKYGIDYNKIIQHLKPFPKDISKYHVDHIVPLCTFELTDPIQIQIEFAPENHQWLLAEDNLKKGGRVYG